MSGQRRGSNGGNAGPPQPHGGSEGPSATDLPGDTPGPAGADDALKRRLHQLYGGVADEPVPDHLAEIIRKAVSAKKAED